MSWTTITWSIMAATCFTLAMVHLSLWAKERTQSAHLLFATFAIAATGVAALEFFLMRAQTIEQFGMVQRWMHLPIFVGVVAIVWFVRVRLRAGRLWLGYAIGVLSLLSLMVNFLSGASLNYSQITGLRRITLWGGETMTVADGVFNPWMLLGQLSLLLLVAYVVDASRAAWRRGNLDTRRSAAVLGGSVVFLILLGVGQYGLVLEGIDTPPYTIMPAFLVMVLALGYKLRTSDVRVEQLGRELESSTILLRQSKQRMELAASASGLALGDWDLNRQTLWVTDQGRVLFGFAHSDPIDPGKILEKIHPEDRIRVRNIVMGLLQRAGEKDTKFRIRFRIQLAGARTRWIAARGRIERNDAGKPTVIRGVCIDITATREAEERFRLVVEAAPNAMVMVDQHGKIMLVNVQLEKVFGYSREELIGSPIEMLIPDGVRADHAGHYKDYRAEPAARPMSAGRDIHGRRKDGSEVPVEISLSTIPAVEGFSVLASIIDITDRRRMEREMNERRNELTHLSRVAMLGEMSGSLAHELNQPLAAILSNAQAAQRFLASGTVHLDEVRDILSDIVKDDKRAGEVIKRLRILLKKEEIQQVPLDINEVVADTLKLIRSDFLNRSVRVNTILAPDLPAVMGDRVQLQQVLLNLFMNSSEAMEDNAASERRLVVLTGHAERNGVEVSVADHGKGIPPDHLDRVFESFVTTKKSGMGLGLAVCRTIVNAHGGRIWATNNTDRGAALHFMLPAGLGGRE